MWAIIVLSALILGCTPLCKEVRRQTVYHNECKEQTLDMGAITKPICVIHYEYTEIISNKPAEKNEE